MNVKPFRIILISIKKSYLSLPKQGAVGEKNDLRKSEYIVWNKVKQQHRRKDYCHNSFGKLDVKWAKINARKEKKRYRSFGMWEDRKCTLEFVKVKLSLVIPHTECTYGKESYIPCWQNTTRKCLLISHIYIY